MSAHLASVSPSQLIMDSTSSITTPQALVAPPPSYEGFQKIKREYYATIDAQAAHEREHNEIRRQYTKEIQEAAERNDARRAKTTKAKKIAVLDVLAAEEYDEIVARYTARIAASFALLPVFEDRKNELRAKMKAIVGGMSEEEKDEWLLRDGR